MSLGKTTLRWAAQSESDLAGFRTYKSQTSGGPWTLAADPGLTGSPTSPAYTLGDFSANGLWYFAVTSYDTVGNESGTSTQTSLTITRPLTSIARTMR